MAASPNVIGRIACAPFDNQGNRRRIRRNYVFRMVPHTDLALMTVTSADGNTSDEFLVRRSIDSQVPHHTELVFNRYGDQEFLTDIYEHGEKTGIAVVEPSREQSRLQKLGQDPVVHTEEQDQ